MIRAFIAPCLAAVSLGLAGGLPCAQAGSLSAFVAGETPRTVAKPSRFIDGAGPNPAAAAASVPLRMRRALFVTEAAPVFGAYTPRASAIFRPTDRIVTYIEPAGYSYQPSGESFVRFGVVLDFDIVLPDGTVAAGKKDFLTWSATSREQLKELMLNASVHFDDGIPEGDYMLRYTLHDINTGQTTDVSLPFKIANET